MQIYLLYASLVLRFDHVPSALFVPRHYTYQPAIY